MKHLFMAFPILALTLVCATFSQDKPAPAQYGGDSMHQMMAGHEGMAKGAWAGERHGMMGAWHGMQGMRECMMPCWQNFGNHHMLLKGVFVFFLLAMALVNILLTILVCMDMARLGCFNALWIPILLLCGIGGTALYALFRIGDQIKAAAKPTV